MTSCTNCGKLLKEVSDSCACYVDGKLIKNTSEKSWKWNGVTLLKAECPELFSWEELGRTLGGNAQLVYDGILVMEQDAVLEAKATKDKALAHWREASDTCIQASAALTKANTDLKEAKAGAKEPKDQDDGKEKPSFLKPGKIIDGELLTYDYHFQWYWNGKRGDLSFWDNEARQGGPSEMRVYLAILDLEQEKEFANG